MVPVVPRTCRTCSVCVVGCMIDWDGARCMDRWTCSRERRTEFVITIVSELGGMRDWGGLVVVKHRILGVHWLVTKQRRPDTLRARDVLCMVFCSAVVRYHSIAVYQLWQLHGLFDDSNNILGNPLSMIVGSEYTEFEHWDKECSIKNTRCRTNSFEKCEGPQPKCIVRF